jgi:UDP-glucose 4-epimerase
MENRLENKSNIVLAGSSGSWNQPNSSNTSFNMAGNGELNVGVSVLVGGKPVTGNNVGDQISSMANAVDGNLHNSEYNRLMENNVDQPWIFITGASGYIGSHLSAEIKSKTVYNVMQIDAKAKYLPHTTRYCDTFADEDFASDLVLRSILQYKPKAVIHLAASHVIDVGQKEPLEYWENNVSKTIKLLNACAAAGVKNFIFASTSAVYADDMNSAALNEENLAIPSTAYARTKYAIELALQDCWHTYKMNSVSFRFFNAAGAHHFYDLGPLYGRSHLLDQIMQAILHQKPLTVFGNDYLTPDGTAIRDYIHVLDIVDALVMSIDWLENFTGCHTLNLGSGQGNSVQQVVDRAEEILNINIPYRYGDRRDGDNVRQIADINKVGQILKWSPKRNINDIIRDSFKWYNSNLYKDLYLKKIWTNTI